MCVNNLSKLKRNNKKPLTLKKSKTKKEQSPPKNEAKNPKTKTKKSQTSKQNNLNKFPNQHNNSFSPVLMFCTCVSHRFGGIPPPSHLSQAECHIKIDLWCSSWYISRSFLCKSVEAFTFKSPHNSPQWESMTDRFLSGRYFANILRNGESFVWRQGCWVLPEYVWNSKGYHFIKTACCKKKIKVERKFQNDTLKLLSLLLYVFSTVMTALMQNTEPKHFWNGMLTCFTLKQKFVL